MKLNCKQKKCLHCENVAKRRGTCRRCYFIGRRRIDNGEVTDDQLVRIGYFLKPRPGGRSEVSDKLDAMLATAKTSSRKNSKTRKLASSK